MIFNSIEFLLFLPTVFLLYWLVFRPLGRWWQNLFVVVASYLFYGWWDIKFLLLIAITTLCSYVSGIAIATSTHKRWWVRGNVVLNLGILGLFKYYDFFAENMVRLLGSFGLTADNVTLDLILPVGISFYTFQALSYTIDVYRQKIEPTRDIVAFFAFISFFPQLVAGPIERATNLLPQFLKPRTFSYPEAVDGMRMILWGLFKKMVVADNCALIVNMVFDYYTEYDGMQLLVAAVLFSFQIYGDFSGYSDIAVGSARLFGIRLMANFRTPYFSRDIAEFWRRWHISLTTWFRDYVYIPLGGSRVKKSKVARNTATIFLLSGFWHGANWTFLAWGGYHSLLFLPLIMSGKNRKYKDTVAAGRMLPKMNECLMILVTFALVMIGWVIFRATDISMAWGYLVRMVTHFHFSLNFAGKFAMIWIAIMLFTEWLYRDREYTLDLNGTHGLLRHSWARWGLYVTICMMCLLFHGTQTDFIYFQF